MELPLRSLLSLNPRTLTLGVIALVVVLFTARVPILEFTELKSFDLRFLSRGALEPAPDVVLATIDEKSLDREGRWPWPRGRIAELVTRLSDAGARVIAFDVGFLEPDESRELAEIEAFDRQVAEMGLAEPELRDFIASRKQDADQDGLLAKAIEKASPAVVLGYFFHMDPSNLDYELAPGEIEERLARIDGSKYPVILADDPDMKAVPLTRAYAPEPNVERLAAVADASGFFDFRPDRDGVVRWIPMVIQGGEEFFPPLAIAAVWHYLGKPPLLMRAGAYGIDGVQLGERLIPTDERGQLLVNYLGPPKSFPHVSIGDIFAGQVPDETFEGKIVLVGATATGIYDLRSTPFSPVFPGVEIHANVIDNVLTGRFMSRPNWTRVYDLLAILVLGLAVALAVPRLGALPALLFAGVLIALHVSAARWLFVHQGSWLSIVYPSLAGGFTYIALTVHAFVSEQRERRRLKGAFGHYVAPIVVEQMLADPSKLKLGGEEKELTVLFSDLAGFTSFSEKYAPNDVIQILGEYYARMTEHVFEHEGMLKEYVGDELMAIFGAPLEREDHAVQACAAALDMRAKRHAMSEEWQQRGRPRLYARTGINTGRMLVGNIGSEYRFAYGALGDNVNLGSRLEGLNKAYGTEILISEGTADQVGDAFQLREVDMVKVVGKEKPTRVFELIARAGEDLSPEHSKLIQSYAAGLEAFRGQHWDEAEACFKECLDLVPSDGPARTLLERCAVYRREPPPPDWDGVFEATKK